MNKVYEKLSKTVVGIAGTGGLGSNVAAALVRNGIGKLIIVDFDVVSEDNLNRQFYFFDQVGRVKVEALTENLERINVGVNIEAINIRLDRENIEGIFSEADIIAECFDDAEQKQILVETVLSRMGDKYVVSASGLAGYGRGNEIVTKRISERLIVVGDGYSGIDTEKVLTAGRVGIAACHQANAIVELIVDEM
ncbi:MAG: sulfur carrier protein ThiS adenylyltransferase ThiF [Phycisphaerae bacterium]|nr:sulfur carrier protein ThiS adenylyltransferase ThiF [Phycisphaerae bacterium]